MYAIPEDDLYAIPTAEVPVTNFFRDEVLETLPFYACGYTPCSRREAGSWVKDVRRRNRLQQCGNVGLVTWGRP